MIIPKNRLEVEILPIFNTMVITTNLPATQENFDELCAQMEKFLCRCYDHSLVQDIVKEVQEYLARKTYKGIL
jgi:hypothetical protein